MLDFLSGALVFILRLVDFVLEIARWVTNMQIIARQLTGSDKLVDVPPEPKVLPPAALRSLAEAEARRDESERSGEASRDILRTP
jgi:hypothetical protein